MECLNVLILIIGFVHGTLADCPIINTEYGGLRGIERENNMYEEEFYCAYLGIPYAEPILPGNMFRESVPVTPWSGVLDATKFGSPCIAYDVLMDIYTGKLDCLFLNIYTPKNIPEGKSLPVMVFIHGGGFIFGDGSDNFYGVDYLIKQDVIIATMNYRLAAFGFLNAGTPDACGNMGLKDQCLAIKMVKQIIHNFQGDPNRLIVFGESAGAASVQFQLLSPMCQDLINGAIIQSGSTLDLWAYTSDDRLGINTLKKSLNLKATTPAEIVQELNNEWTPLRIVETFYEPFRDDNTNALDIMAFVPCKESVVEGCTQFLPDTPENLMRQGKMRKVPIIDGVNAEEGALFATELINYFNQLDNKDPDQFNAHLPDDVKCKIADPSNLAQRIFEFYTGEPLLGGTEKEITIMLTDLLFDLGWVISLGFYAQNNIEAYGYFYQYCTVDTLIKEYLKLNECSAMHADEIFHLFHVTVLGLLPEEEDEIFFNALMVKLWTDFAKYGTPTPEDSEYPTWHMYNENKQVYVIDKEPKMESLKNLKNNFYKRICFLTSLGNDEYKQIMFSFGMYNDE